MQSIKKRRFYILGLILLAVCGVVYASHFFGNVALRPDAPVLAFKKFGVHPPKPLLLSYAVTLLVLVLGFLLNPFKEFGGMYGSSHFATESEIKAMGMRGDTGLILGKKGGRYLRVTDPLSVLVFAPPGTGKTAATVIPSLLASDASTVTLDVKGELLEKTGPYRSEFSTVQKFAPGELDSLSWNPLAKAELPSSWDDIEVHVNRIGECLLTEPKEGDHWMAEARRIFTFWALYLIHTQGFTSFKEILASALSEDPQGAIEDRLLEEGLPERVRLEGNALVSKADKEFSGVLSSFSKAMNVFLDPRVAKNTTESQIQLTKLREERTSIYLVVSNQDSRRLKPILTLFFELAANTALAKEPEPHEMGITLFLDEFVRLGRMEEVKRVPAIGRSYRFVCFFVVQTLAQLQNIYGQDGADEFLGTCSYLLFFTQNEPKVAQMLSQAVGNKTVKTKSRSGRMMEAKSTSEGETGLPLIRPEEILSLPFGDLIILRQNNFKTPVAASAAFWFRESSLKRCVEYRGAATLEPETVVEEVELAPIGQSADSDLTIALETTGEIEAVEVEPATVEDAFEPADPADAFEPAAAGWSDADLNVKTQEEF